MRRLLLLLLVALACCRVTSVRAELDRATLAQLVLPPYQLGEPVEGLPGVWSIVSSGGGFAGYVFESWPLAPIPGFAGEPINLLITLDRDGRFLDVTVLQQREPIFVAGLGREPFDAFLRQYRGHSVGDAITVGAADGRGRRDGSTHVYVDAVSRATASVRIANEAILAAARTVARQRMQGLRARAVGRPIPDYRESLDWTTLVADGIARPLRVSNRELQALFVGSVWENDDPAVAADPDGTYLDLWVVDVGPPSIAGAMLDVRTLQALARTSAPEEAPILLLANGRHRLLGDDFIRNTEPDGLTATQDELPVSLRHADVELRLAPGVPAFDQAVLLRADTRLGFDPASPWTLRVRAVRAHGSFRPEVGGHDLSLDYHPPPRFYDVADGAAPSSPIASALRQRAPELIALAVLLAGLSWLLARRMRQLARHRHFSAFRLAVLAVTVVFVGWAAQGQLSIVTPLAVLQSAIDGSSLAFLLYEPLLLLLWAVALLSLAVWGRGFFCGWLCPYGALQELAHAAGRRLGLQTVRVHPRIDRRLKWVKYVVLAAVVGGLLSGAPVGAALIEVEPFKTAFTLSFDRSWPYVAYALFWIGLGVFVFKAFCRYVCPLGAALALGGRLRQLDWIARRAECGTPCQFCKARCAYGAIDDAGRIDYPECFQCLDCVRILEVPQLCIPERLAQKTGRALTPRST